MYNVNIFRNRYIIIDEKTGKIMWRPILDFDKNMNFEATKVFGARGDGTLFCYGCCYEGICDANISVVKSIDQYLFHYFPPPPTYKYTHKGTCFIFCMCGLLTIPTPIFPSFNFAFFLLSELVNTSYLGVRKLREP